MMDVVFDQINVYRLLKTFSICFIIVLLVRTWAYAVKDREESEEKVLELEANDGSSDLSLSSGGRGGKGQPIVPVSKTIYEENICLICKKAIWSREGIELKKGTTVELKCTHRFHWHCLTKTPATTSSKDETDSSYVMVDKVPRCPTCHFQPIVIEAKPLHKWQTTRFWVLIIDEALDQLARFSGTYGIGWANVRARARKMSGITLEQLAAGERQTYGEEDMLDEDDLGGPGEFPYFPALKDGNGERFQDATANVYHKAAGKWLTWKNEGGERMVFKYSWGIPPDTNCHNCQKWLDPEDKDSVVQCQACQNISVERKFFCSDACYSTHALGEECRAMMNKYERFRISKTCS